MARPRVPSTLTAAAQVQGKADALNKVVSALAPSASVYRPGTRNNPVEDRGAIAKPWQMEAYRQVNICGEARYAATLFAAIAARAEFGVSEPNALRRKAAWITEGPEVDAFNELVPTVRERTKLAHDYMLHRVIAGECYLIARDRRERDPEYTTRRYEPVWEIVAVTELRKMGDQWSVRYDNDNYIDLSISDPVIRLWCPDPSNRREAWSPYRSLLPTLREIEWLTKHIFTQVRSRLMSAGVWFLPENLTFPPPPPDKVNGGAEAIARMNEPEKFMVSLAASSMQMLDGDEVSLPTVVMADAAALESVDQEKLIKFWSTIDDKAMLLRSDAVRRFALGMDLPPEQVLGSSGLAVSGSSGSAGSVNHWGVWAGEEQTISSHIEPALDDFVGALTTAFLREAVEGTDKVIAYDTATLRLRQDRSKEAMQWYTMGVLKAEVALRESGFDPENDMMDDNEHRIWLLNRVAGGSATPEQVQAAMALLGVDLPVTQVAPVAPEAPKEAAPGLPGRNLPPSLKDNEVHGPPQGDHEHKPAPYNALVAAGEVLALRALEKAGNRLLNDGKRGRDKDRNTPAHMAHCLTPVTSMPEFDFTLIPVVLAGASVMKQTLVERKLNQFCEGLYREGSAYSRDALIEALSGLEAEL